MLNLWNFLKTGFYEGINFRWYRHHLSEMSRRPPSTGLSLLIRLPSARPTGELCDENGFVTSFTCTPYQRFRCEGYETSCDGPHNVDTTR